MSIQVEIQSARSRDWRERRGKPVVFVDWQFEGDILDMMSKRGDRPNRAVLEAVKRRLRLVFGEPNIGLTWDRHAGCSMCPCSPGFVVQRTQHGRMWRKDIWVSVSNMEENVVRDEARHAAFDAIREAAADVAA